MLSILERARRWPSFGRTAGLTCANICWGADGKKQSMALTSPGIIYKDLIIVGGAIRRRFLRRPEIFAPTMCVRGRCAGRFHTIPHPGDFGYETWPKDAWKYAGAANNWAGMAVDAERGIVYVPTGSAAFDFYGGDRVATICLRIRCWRWMRKRANGSGTFRECITISGTAIFRRRQRW